MAMSKNKTLLVKGCLLMSLILCGCGGKALSQREIVRGVLFTQQGSLYSVCLVLANQQQSDAQAPENRVVAAQGETPAQALQRAEDSLYGEVYYGLLDMAALPADCSWQTAQQIGNLLYENAQPAPELSVFLLDSVPVESWAQQGSILYQNMKALEVTYKVHCGLQQIFAQPNVCAVPAYRNAGGYDFVLLAKDAAPRRFHGLAGAQLAAVLTGQTNRLKGTFASGTATCEARAQITMEGEKVQLHLRDLRLQALTEENVDLEEVLRRELEDSFDALYRSMEPTGTDPFHLQFRQACTYGISSTVSVPTLEVMIE